MLSGLEKVDEGHILIQGQDLSQLTDAQLTAFRREKIAFIFQQYYLLPNLTVRQNVKMGANLANNHDFLQIIEDLGLGDKLDKYPSELSGGEQQRVSIARALAKKPEILFLDSRLYLETEGKAGLYPHHGDAQPKYCGYGQNHHSCQ